ncbi:ectoine/hydroxyectoine ABC transporter substrate-binding protein EhuB [Halolactibacillus alkaliphilus]|uniref:Ectoine/hydroxyectoine ABC transporter substrate-binding protein EhuB n=1 Tax=Halolactibacillus alkaliphilus TaxID=442899 RepID=A0A511X0Z2_9BACI|nr:ectoine/hydroxyectoine ABC transporter substrate-binding protein EhuB [Halolactibacillus alkaliphilus]GEN56618.1 ectoine/hydroxyectoine ABC transporter substrate-binding protein EhuB [Halolactibacillus alkaliphilus]GGN69808.1 ectoine/hydroxyectoine ABC transporter substrate-binding protein EhuB [Halolactibacillus alkaliphilus]SFO76069.1 amino acid ABC transporter substrate-binding protein, PAAT family [Halolactibacillus alkaliphilus]
MKKIMTGLVLLSIVLFISACGNGEENEGSSLDQLKEQGYVTVGFANEDPYAYEEDGELKGAAYDIAAAVFNELGIEEVRGSLQDWGQLIPGVQAGQFDAVTAGMAITPSRAENVLFGEPEMTYGEGLVVEAGNPHGIESFEDIAANEDITVIVMEGATGIAFLRQSGVSDDQITYAASIPDTFAAVQSGRADATTGTEMTMRMAFESANTEALDFVETFEQPDVEGVPSYGAAAFSLENDDLRDAYNEALQVLKDNGTVQELLQKNGFHPESNFPGADITTESIVSGENY